MYRGEPNIRQFLVAEREEYLRHADERFARSMRPSRAEGGVRGRVSDARAWMAAWRWPHDGGRWQSVHTPGHWRWPHGGGHWRSPHGVGHAH